MATDQLIARDAVIRQAAFDHIRDLRSRDLILSHDDIARGFMFEGQRWPLWNPQRGNFKPRGMPFLLSIRTVFPRKGGRVWYDDQRQVHRQIFAGDEELGYAFMGTDPSAPDNVWLREAAERQIPFIYFLGVWRGRGATAGKAPTRRENAPSAGRRGRGFFGDFAIPRPSYAPGRNGALRGLCAPRLVEGPVAGRRRAGAIGDLNLRGRRSVLGSRRRATFPP